jgi:hypothetical protein
MHFARNEELNTIFQDRDERNKNGRAETNLDIKVQVPMSKEKLFRVKVKNKKWGTITKEIVQYDFLKLKDKSS